MLISILLKLPHLTELLAWRLVSVQIIGSVLDLEMILSHFSSEPHDAPLSKPFLGWRNEIEDRKNLKQNPGAIWSERFCWRPVHKAIPSHCAQTRSPFQSLLGFMHMFEQPASNSHHISICRVSITALLRHLTLQDHAGFVMVTSRRFSANGIPQGAHHHKIECTVDNMPYSSTVNFSEMKSSGSK